MVQYADDALALIEDGWNMTLKLKGLLYCFESVTCLHLNSLKKVYEMDVQILGPMCLTGRDVAQAASLIFI